MADKILLARWKGGYRADVNVRDFDIVADEPPSAGGDDAGPAPTELFLASLATCFTLAVVHAARKRDVELGELAVRVEADYGKFRYAKLRVNVEADLPRSDMEPLVEQAKDYCFVSRTLADPPDVEYVIVE